MDNCGNRYLPGSEKLGFCYPRMAADSGYKNEKGYTFMKKQE